MRPNHPMLLPFPMSIPVWNFHQTRVPEVGGARGAAAPPCPLTGGQGGAEDAPQLRKHDIVIIHISLNLRRIKEKNDNFFHSGGKSASNLWCFNCTNMNNNKKSSRTWQNALFVRLRRFSPAALHAPFARFVPPALKRFRHPWHQICEYWHKNFLAIILINLQKNCNSLLQLKEY